MIYMYTKHRNFKCSPTVPLNAVVMFGESVYNSMLPGNKET